MGVDIERQSSMGVFLDKPGKLLESKRNIMTALRVMVVAARTEEPVV